MKERIWHCLCQTLNALIIAGIIILLIGLYYLIIKAGIPYQDPPLDLQHGGIPETVLYAGLLLRRADELRQ